MKANLIFKHKKQKINYNFGKNSMILNCRAVIPSISFIEYSFLVFFIYVLSKYLFLYFHNVLILCTNMSLGIVTIPVLNNLSIFIHKMISTKNSSKQ